MENITYMQQIDLQKRFKAEICSFEMAKKIRAAGMTCANTYFSYDEDGQVGDGAWLGEISERYGMAPCVQFPFAVAMLEEVIEDFDNISISRYDMADWGERFEVAYDGEAFESNNLVDAILSLWLKYKKQKETALTSH